MARKKTSNPEVVTGIHIPPMTAEVIRDLVEQHENGEKCAPTQDEAALVILGDISMFQLLCGAVNEMDGRSWSAKAIEIPGCGCVVQSMSQQTNPDGSMSLAESMVFVPNVKIVSDEPNGGRKLQSTAPVRPV